MVVFRAAFLLAALGGLGWFNFINTAPAHVLAREALDTLDERPAQTYLFVGNSRMFGNDMPYMIRGIADSAGAPIKYQVRMWALPGASFEAHWRTGKVQRLLAEKKWDGLVLQGESSAHWNERYGKNLVDHGTKLTTVAESKGVATSVIVSWNYGPSLFEGQHLSQSEYYGYIQADYRALAAKSGARLINVGAASKRALAGDLPFKLHTDDNHPSLHGSYLTALMIYAHLSGDDPEKATFIPEGLSKDDALLIRRFVSDFLRSGITVSAPTGADRYALRQSPCAAACRA